MSCYIKLLLPWTDKGVRPAVLSPLSRDKNDRRFADDIFKFTSMYKFCFIVVKITLEFVTKGPINYMSGLV